MVKEALVGYKLKCNYRTVWAANTKLMGPGLVPDLIGAIFGFNTVRLGAHNPPGVIYKTVFCQFNMSRA